MLCLAIPCWNWVAYFLRTIQYNCSYSTTIENKSFLICIHELSSIFHPWGFIILFYNPMINWTSLSMFRLKAFVTNRLISNDYFNISLDVEKLFRKYRWLGYPQIWSVEILQWPHDSNHYYFCILLVDSLG